MSELIDKNELLKKAVTIPGPSGKSVYSVVFTDDIINAKAIEPKTGHWIDEGFYAEGHSEHAFMCSKCSKHYIGYAEDFKWCPCCGSRNEVKE